MSRPKRKFISAHDQEQLIQEFCDQLNEDDREFLGNLFAGEIDKIMHLVVIGIVTVLKKFREMKYVM